jgi:hypothetical protein
MALNRPEGEHCDICYYIDGFTHTCHRYPPLPRSGWPKVKHYADVAFDGAGTQWWLVGYGTLP